MNFKLTKKKRGERTNGSTDYRYHKIFQLGDWATSAGSNERINFENGLTRVST